MKQAAELGEITRGKTESLMKRFRIMSLFPHKVIFEHSCHNDKHTHTHRNRCWVTMSGQEHEPSADKRHCLHAALNCRRRSGRHLFDRFRFPLTSCAMCLQSLLATITGWPCQPSPFSLRIQVPTCMLLLSRLHGSEELDLGEICFGKKNKPNN